MIMRAPHAKTYTRPWRQFGLGALGDYSDWAAKLGLEDCSQTTVAAQYACSQRNDARIQGWASSPQQVTYQSNVAAAEAAGVAASGGSPQQFLQQFEINNPNVTPQTIAAATAPPPPAPPQVVNPSPPSQPTGTSTSSANPVSTTSTANGTAGTTGSTGNPASNLLSTVEGYVTGSDWISGIPNWAVLAAGGVAVFLLMGHGAGKAR